MTAGVEISLFMGYLHGVNTGLRGPAVIGHFIIFGPVRPFGMYIYIFYIGWGSEMGLWVMVAGVIISLYTGYMHGVNTGLGGLTHIGDIPPVGRGLTPKKFFSYIFSIYVGGRNHFGGSWLRE